ncbi:DUF3253 domain-containing protein [Mycobacterium sp. UM_Kg1]|uniref:DUF3253 domain-containing protein n=1 Tax=Mycobacterium sp. UM_Kg1 TaxID=1545691 RepID=UPI0009E18DB0|nr:DUF3253 domain-containing protein [Mycobacterium sp. UM_Kg1]
MAEPQNTADGRFIVVNGRRWRATDPSIPDSLRQELVNALMAARRAVRDAGENARLRVHDAKVALGERGEPWWDRPSVEGLNARIDATICTLARHRAPGTACPSDIARVVGGAGDWRDLMETVRARAKALADQGVIDIQQRGHTVDPAAARGPIRLAAAHNIDMARTQS